jgi:hypothetical protein
MSHFPHIPGALPPHEVTERYHHNAMDDVKRAAYWALLISSPFVRKLHAYGGLVLVVGGVLGFTVMLLTGPHSHDAASFGGLFTFLAVVVGLVMMLSAGAAAIGARLARRVKRDIEEDWMT